MKFKIGDIVLHDCECGSPFCNDTKNIPLVIIHTGRDDEEIEYLLFNSVSDGRQWFKEYKLRSYNPYLIRQRLGIK